MTDERCAWCAAALASSVSDDFCSEPCQVRWHSAGHLPADLSLGAAVAGFARGICAVIEGLPRLADQAELLTRVMLTTKPLPTTMFWPPPDEPAVRALRLQRNRNTGPCTDRYGRRGLIGEDSRSRLSNKWSDSSRLRYRRGRR